MCTMEATTKSPDPPTKLVPATSRFEQDVLDLLKLDAQTNGRTVSQSIRHYVRRGMGLAA